MIYSTFAQVQSHVSAKITTEDINDQEQLDVAYFDIDVHS